MRHELLAKTGAPIACRNYLSSQRQSQVGWPAVLLHGGSPIACRNCLIRQRQSPVGWPAVLLHGGDLKLGKSRTFRTFFDLFPILFR